MEIQKIVIKAYQKKYIHKEQFLELNRIAQNGSTEELTDYLKQHGILTQEQLEELKALVSITASTDLLKESLSPPQPEALSPQELQEELKKLTQSIPKSEEWLGKTFTERYRIHTLLGKGGMGVVYLAQDSKLNRNVALKIVHFEPEEKEERQNRFLQEATSLAKLNHPNIVRIYEVGEEPECYFTMEYVSGETLDQILKREGKLRSREAAEYIQKIAEALVEVHEQQLTHLDIKPSNIMLSEKNEIKLMDFGLARKLESKKSKLTKIAGTVEYMAPEQIRGMAQHLNAKTDIYLLGGSLYELLTGKAPFEGETEKHKLYQALYLDPILPHKLNPSVHNDLEAICLKALEKEQNRRYESAKAFGEDLKNFLEHKVVQAKRPTKWTYVRKWIRRNPVVSALLLLFVLAMTGLLGYFQWKEHLRQVEEETNKKAHFKKLSEDTGSLVEVAQSIERVNKKEELSLKVQALLQGLNLVNEALSLYPKEVTAENRKLQVGKNLLQRCYESKDYELALYVAENLNSLSILSEEEKEGYRKEVEKERDKVVKEELESLEKWFGKADGKIHFYDEFLLKNPEYTEAYSSRGSAKQELKNYEGAIQDFTEAIRLNPQFAEAYIGRGNAKQELKNYEAAIQDYIEALRLNPQYVEAYLNRGTAKFALKDYTGAVQDYTEAIRLNPQDAGAYTNRGNAKRQLKDYGGAIQDHTEALRLNPNYAKAYLNRGNTKNDLTDYKGAIQDYTEAIRLNPQYVGAYFNRGLSQFSNGNLEEGFQDFSEANQLSQGIHRANFIQNYSHFEEEYSKKDIDKSLRLFQERKKYEPTARFSSELADALFARVIQSYQKKDFKSAKADLEWLEQCADPTHPKYSKIPQMKAEIEKHQ
jgi:serine/threonine protein kinase/Flp pilus assembly protein TadD